MLVRLFVVVVAFVHLAAGQQPSVPNSVAAEFASGKFADVAEKLKDSKQPGDLFYLGLAYEKLGNSGKAIDAFEKAVERSFQDFRVALEKLWPTLNGETFVGTLRKHRESNLAATMAIDRLMEIHPRTFSFNDARLRANAIRNAAALADSTVPILDETSKDHGFLIGMSPPMSGLAELLSKSRISPARGKSGRVFVRVAAVFGADGSIQLAMPLDDIVDAYTVATVVFLDRTEYQPAKLNGEAVHFFAKIARSYAYR